MMVVEKENVLKETLYIVMPAYNEEGTIEEVVRSWYKVLNYSSAESRLVVADGGCADKTHKILLDLQTSMPKLEILKTTRKEHGPKLIALYKHAIERGAEYIFQTDSDGQTNPSEFGEFWNDREKYDAIFGYRSRRGDGKARYLVEKCVCLILLIIFGTKVKDANAPFRLFRATVLKKYIDLFEDDYNLPNIMLTTFYVYNDERYTFKEISFSNRKKGTNSINLYKICKIGLFAIFDFIKFKYILKDIRNNN